jgi:hypothetical protein
MKPGSVNLGVLAVHDAQLVQVAGQAEGPIAEHPNTLCSICSMTSEPPISVVIIRYAS